MRTKMKRTCYVCGVPIKGTPVYIAHGLYRHKNCEPLSARWFRSEIGKRLMKQLRIPETRAY